MACLLLFIRTSTAEGQQIFADKGVAATDMAYAYLNLGLEGYGGKGKAASQFFGAKNAA